MNRTTTTARIVAGLVATTGVLAVAGGALAAGSSARSSGPDVHHVASPFDDASATVQVTRTGAGGSLVNLHVWGVDAPAGQTFGAHVHTAACGTDPLASGGHYQHAVATADLEDREVWLDVTLNEDGNGHSQAMRPWAVDESTPRSVVIHALPTNPASGAAGARLACIDLDGQH